MEENKRTLDHIDCAPQFCLEIFFREVILKAVDDKKPQEKVV